MERHAILLRQSNDEPRRLAEEPGGGGELWLQRRRNGRGRARESVRAFASPPPPPTYKPRTVKSRRRGVGERGINCAHSPTFRDYCALTTCRNCRWKACGPLWATENPRLGLGVGVVGPRPTATSCRARGLAGSFQPRDATWFKGGERPAHSPARAPTDSRLPTLKIPPRRRAQPKPAPSCWLVKIRS